MFADLVKKSAKSEVNEWRSGTHRLYDPDSASNDFPDLEAIPASIVIAEHFIGSEIKFEDIARFTSGTAGKDLPEKISEHAKKEDYKCRKTSHDKHRRNDDKGQRVLAFFNDTGRRPLLKLVVVYAAHLFALFCTFHTRLGRLGFIFGLVFLVLLGAFRVSGFILQFHSEIGHNVADLFKHLVWRIHDE